METIVALSMQEIAPLAKDAARDHVSLKDTTSAPTLWFGMRGAWGSRPFIVAGLLVFPSGNARIRGVWCDPQFRGKGRGAALMDFLVEEAKRRGCCQMSQLAASPRWWVEKRGWHVTKALPDGKAWIMKVI